MEELKLSTDGLKEVTFKDGEVILEEGKKGRQVLILKEGTAKIVVGGNELGKFNASGTILGEIGALLGSECTADVVAEGECIFFVIDDLLVYFEENSKAALEVARVLASRVANMNQQFVEIRHEIDTLRSGTSSAKQESRFSRLLTKMDAFWGKEILTSVIPPPGVHAIDPSLSEGDDK